MSLRAVRFVLPVALPLLLLSAATAGIFSLSEDFSSLAYCDNVQTSALWDTGTGELRLNPFQPVVEGSYNTSGSTQDIAVDGNHAFLADGPAGLQILDIADPKAPIYVSGIPIGGDVFGIEVHGEGLHARWLLVVEVSVDRQGGEGLRRDIDRERLVEGDLVGCDPRLGKAVWITDPVSERPGLPPRDLRAE